VVYVLDPDFSFEWCLDELGDPQPRYWKKEMNCMIDIILKEYSNVEEAINFIKEVKAKKDYWYSDVTKDYL
jgi:hypothetical protein